MGLTLAIDFGSTYIKVVAVDLAREEVVAVVQAKSTVQSDVKIGLEAALKKLEDITGIEKSRVDGIVSCSSAAGGLRMVVAGLVRGLTTKAAQEACLGAGAKLVAAYSNGLSPNDIDQIESMSPDIILLSGGTDGGNEEVIVHNAKLVAKSDLISPVIVAGNKMAAPKVQSILEEHGKYVVTVDNVLPELDKLNVEPTREVIRNIFMERIVSAKGLDRTRAIVGDIIMPTPMAVLNAATLLAEGTEGEPGLGDLIVVDVGGATTDVHSIGHGNPSMTGIMIKGLPEPYRKRTVEGDLGIRYNAQSILELVGEQGIIDRIPFPEKIGRQASLGQVVHFLCHDVAAVPNEEEDYMIDVGLASTAVNIAVKRHAGFVEEVYLPTGKVRIQHGKDLTEIKCMIGTGGIFAYGRLPNWILRAGCHDDTAPQSLLPINPDLFIDERYIMYAVGLLSVEHPGKALRIMKQGLKKIEQENGQRLRRYK